jgi:hypothetical protein
MYTAPCRSARGRDTTAYGRWPGEERVRVVEKPGALRVSTVVSPPPATSRRSRQSVRRPAFPDRFGAPAVVPGPQDDAIVELPVAEHRHSEQARAYRRSTCSRNRRSRKGLRPTP